MRNKFITLNFELQKICWVFWGVGFLSHWSWTITRKSFHDKVLSTVNVTPRCLWGQNCGPWPKRSCGVETPYCSGWCDRTFADCQVPRVFPAVPGEKSSGLPAPKFNRSPLKIGWAPKRILNLERIVPGFLWFCAMGVFWDVHFEHELEFPRFVVFLGIRNLHGIWVEPTKHLQESLYLY